MLPQSLRLQSKFRNFFGCSPLGNIHFYGQSIREMPRCSNIVSLSGKHSVIYVRPCGKVAAHLTIGHVGCNAVYTKKMEWVTAYIVAPFSAIKLYVSRLSVLLSVICIVRNTKYAFLFRTWFLSWTIHIAGTWNSGWYLLSIQLMAVTSWSRVLVHYGCEIWLSCFCTQKEFVRYEQC